MINQLILLGMLMEGNMHGYQLNDYVKHVMILYTDLKKSTTYFVLDKLEKEGYVSHEIEREGKRPERRVFEITQKGKVRFYELLRECISGYIPPHLSDDFGVSFIDKLEVSEAKELLETKRQKIKSELTKLKGVTGHEGNLKYIIDHSLAYLNADLKWVDSILKGIKS